VSLLVRTVRWTIRVAVAVALYLLAVALLPIFPRPRQPLPYGRTAASGPDDAGNLPAPVRVRIPIDPAQTAQPALIGHLYLPEHAAAPVPCIVMAHGLGGTVATGLDAYARRFQAAGYAVLAFDYRHFGESEGEPRQLIWIPTQLEDWRAALRFARARTEIDAQRIALWGSSLAGGHVVTIAAADHDVSCIVAQCPGLDGRAGAEMAFHRTGPLHGMKLIVHAQRDLVRSWFRLSEHKVPIVGRTGTTALMASDAAWDAFCRLAPPDYVNEACARIAIRGDKYRPVTQARHVRCPALLQVCGQDEFTPIRAAEETARRMGDRAEVVRYPIGHFDIYFGEHFETAVRDQLDFLRRRL
jgi:fermentation-respiration switch protein FrsA (DUF1100 family)